MEETKSRNHPSHGQCFTEKQPCPFLILFAFAFTTQSEVKVEATCAVSNGLLYRCCNPTSHSLVMFGLCISNSNHSATRTPSSACGPCVWSYVKDMLAGSLPTHTLTCFPMQRNLHLAQPSPRPRSACRGSSDEESSQAPHDDAPSASSSLHGPEGPSRAPLLRPDAGSFAQRQRSPDVREQTACMEVWHRMTLHPGQFDVRCPMLGPK